MTFDVQVAHSVEEIGQEAWDDLSGGRPFNSYRWYRYGEAVLSDNEPVYIILSRGGRPVARSTFWLRRQEQLPIFSSKVVRRLIEALLRRRPLLLCRAPLAPASGLILPEEPSLRDEALGTMAKIAQDRARHNRASFITYVYLKEEEAGYPGWPSNVAGIRMSEPGTRMVITWSDFETYLGDVSRSVRRNYRDAVELGVRTTRHPMTGAWEDAALDEMVKLIQNVENHHNAARNPWARAMLEKANMVDAVWLRSEMDERTACCGLLLRDGDTQMMTLLGRDYDVQYAYFHLFYSGIRCAIEDGVRVVWGGSGAYGAKRRMGFEVKDASHVLFASRGPLLQRVGRWAAAMEREKP